MLSKKLLNGYSALIPNFLINPAQYCVSASINKAVEAGVEFVSGSKPNSMNRAKFAGIAITRLIVVFNKSITSVGVPFGTKMTPQVVVTKPGTPASMAVGTFGNKGERLADTTANAFNAPESIYCEALEIEPK